MGGATDPAVGQGDLEGVAGPEHRARAGDVDGDHTFLTPVFGVAFAFLATAERPGGWTAAGLALVLGSLWVVVREPDARSRPAERPVGSD